MAAPAGKFCVLSLFFVLILSPVLANSKSDTVSVETEQDIESCKEKTNRLDKHEALLLKLEELVKNLSEIVSKFESKSISEPEKLKLPLQESVKLDKDVDEVETKGKAGSVTKFSPFWSEKFQFVSAVKLDSEARSIIVLPFRDYEGLSKYFGVGDSRGRVYVLSRNGDVSVEFYTGSGSAVTAMVSYFSAYKNESIVITGHENGSILMHRVYEREREEWNSLTMENLRIFGVEDRTGITILEVHHVGPIRYILATDLTGKITVFTANGNVHGSVTPRSKPVAFLKQRLLFLTESGAGSLDLRTMKVRESECEGLNRSFARNYVFDPTERSKAYGFTSDGDIIHVLLLGDIMNFKCRVRSKKKYEMEEPLALQPIKGYVLVVDEEKVFVYNVSAQHYVRNISPRLVFSAGLDDIKSSFLNSKSSGSVNQKFMPLISGDQEKLIVLGLGGGYVSIYKSKLPVFKAEVSSILWTSPVFFFVVFLFGAWYFFAKKKEALTSWGPDDLFTSTGATSGAPLGSTKTDRSDHMELRPSGLPSRRYVSPSRYSGVVSTSFRPGESGSRAGQVDPSYRTSTDIKFRGSVMESAMLSKRREGLFANSQVVDDNS